jgi:NADPH2:quinone reductase
MTAARTARAVIVEEPGPPDSLRLVYMPARELSVEDVRVRVTGAGVNPVDAENRADPAWAGISPPYVVGYEFAGVIEEVGDHVAATEVGDEVWGLLPVRGTPWGAYADEVVVEERYVARRPQRISAMEAAAVPLAGSTALQLLDRLCPRPGEWLLIYAAAGGVGHLLVQLAKHRGVRVAALASRIRHPLLERLGADVAIDRHDPRALDLACEAAGGAIPMAADLVGDGALARSLDAIAEGGRVASIVGMRGDFELAIDRNITLHGVLVQPSRSVLGSLVESVDDGGVRPFIEEAMPLEHAAIAHERIEARGVQGKLVLAMESYDG